MLCFRAPRAKIVREISSDVVSHTNLSASKREQLKIVYTVGDVMIKVSIVLIQV